MVTFAKPLDVVGAASVTEVTFTEQHASVNLVMADVEVLDSVRGGRVERQT